MDFLDPKKKRRSRILLFVGYGLMAIALGFGTLFLFNQSNGYHLDPKTGQIVQNGFVFIDAHPEAATIKLNNQDKGQTDQRLDLPAGKYHLELSRPGYRTWKRDFVLEGGVIERFVYPFLFPEKLVPKDVQLYGSAPGLVTETPDRKWAVVQQPGSLTNFDIVDLSSEIGVSRTVSLPPGLLKTTGDSHSLELVEWSTDNRHVLLKHNFQGGNEFFVLDIESGGDSVNVTAAFASTPFTALSLRDKKYDQYYLFNQPNQTLQSANLKDRQVATVLSDVLAFKSHGSDVIAYVTDADAPDGKVLFRVREGSNSYTVRELPANSTYFVDIARFDNAWFVAGGSASEQKAYVYKNPVAAVKRLGAVKPVPVSVLKLDKAPEFISFSANARFIAIQGGSQLSVYDAETDRQYRYDSGIPLAPNQQFTWMDGHRLVAAAGSKTYVFDYDGTNKQELVPALDGTTPLFNNDYTALFNAAPSVQVPSRFAITRTPLRAAQ